MASEEVKFVLAGDVLDNISKLDENSRIVLGPGLKRDSDKIIATVCGILKKKGRNTFWIDNHQKRYIPVRNECVIGIVRAKAGDIFRVDIGASEHASLPFLSFEGATKKNRPMIQMGDILYGKLLVANKDTEPELACVDQHDRSSGMGILEGGFMFETSVSLVRKILSPTCTLCKSLGQHFKFEIVLGMNGRVWIKADTVQQTIAVANAICLAEYMTNAEISIMCQRLANVVGAH